MKKKPIVKTKGQEMAEEARRLTDHASGQERQRLLAGAMAIIYGN